MGIFFSETGWKVGDVFKFLLKAAPGIAVGGGTIEAHLDAKGTPVVWKGFGIGLGLGLGASATARAEAAKAVLQNANYALGTEVMRSLVKYGSALKWFSLKSELYRYELNNKEPS